MPIYEYKCLNCKKEFSLLQSVGSLEKDTKCSFCGSDSVKKKLSSFSCSASGGSDFAPACSAGVSGG